MPKTPRIKPLSLKDPLSQRGLSQSLETEWLRSNRLGAYSAGTILGCNTRRYHGLLVAATNPPVGRVLALSTLMEQLVVDGKIIDLATNEFADTFSPNGAELLAEFRDDHAATFVWQVGETTVTREVLLAADANAVAVRYHIDGPAEKLLIRPFTALRDFHALRRNDGREWTVDTTDAGVSVCDPKAGIAPLHLTCKHTDFDGDPQWWYRLLYRVDRDRGQDAFEDLYSPGLFTWTPNGKNRCKLVASLGEPVGVGMKSTIKARRDTQKAFLAGTATDDRLVARLAASAAAYVANRQTEQHAGGLSILAGFPWFADWGRDAFIALPGLLLETGQLELARGVFCTYAEAIHDGLVPNRFDDYGGEPHYNTVDASLWFIMAAERYMQCVADDVEASGFWTQTLRPACETILRHYRDGTRFGIHAADDGLLLAGGPETQLTWMDAKLGEEVITARYGKPVEINAMWHSAHCILAERCRGDDPDAASTYARHAAGIASAFIEAFWNPEFRWLNDVITPAGPDASLRPNQVLAVSLPHSPLSTEQQRAILNVIEEKLLTPVGLRTLSPDDSRYRRRYGGCWESRERAYHQGTVWAWLIGPFIEAYLKVEAAAGNAHAPTQARRWLSGFADHLEHAGLGHVSEIFDGDWPHHPRGCFAQAWSVAEVLRACRLVDRAEAEAGK
ncbi:MAG: glycogen debranching protein [Planctomycetes bacterium]|jgi:predicted glycogen debranching enzyme|nr:glycogen debranching protein [Planctomycetota bacterium]